MLAVFSANREEWLVAALGAMALGGAVAGLYPTASDDQLLQALQDCGARAVVVDDAPRLQRVLALQPQLPGLEHVLVMNPAIRQEGVHGFQRVLQHGQGLDDRVYWEGVHALEPSDLAVLLYTTGPAGKPRAARITHRNVLWTAQKFTAAVGLGERESHLSFLSLAHVAEQMSAVYAALLKGVQVFFAGAPEMLIEDLRAVRPTVFVAVPRTWERLERVVRERLPHAGSVEGRVLERARATTLRRHLLDQRRERVPKRVEAEYQAARPVLFAPLKHHLGLDRTRLFFTTGAPSRREVLELFASLDLVIREIYGLAETCGPTALNTPVATQLGSLGQPMLGVEVKLAEDGEILVRGGNVCAGYHGDPEAALFEGGWLASGDLGELDAEGYLRLLGRKSDALVLSTGRKVFPGPIEAMLQSISPVAQAVVTGDGRPSLVALVTLDPERAAALAREQGLPESASPIEQNARWTEYLQHQLEQQVNPRLDRQEVVRRVAVVSEPFLPGQRREVEAQQAALLESLYRSIER